MSAPASAVLTEGSPRQKVITYGVRAHAAVRCPLDKIADLRQRLGPPGEQPFPAAFLKPCDEQTVVAVAAVLQAIDRHGLEWGGFAEWAVIAAPRFFGRLNCADTLAKFETGGAWKAPPLFVAHRSLHAASGTISQALQCRGPNFGVGGGGNAAAEGLLTALTVLEEHRLPGLWLVLTECDPEPRPDPQGVNSVPVVCQALAMAFMPLDDVWHGPCLRLRAAGRAAAHPGYHAHRSDVFAGLLRFFDHGYGDDARSWACSFSWGCELQLTTHRDFGHPQ